MPTVLIERTQVHVPQSIGVPPENRLPFHHRLVDRLCVGHVETQSRVGQRLEKVVKLVDGPTAALAGVHVLKD